MSIQIFNLSLEYLCGSSSVIIFTLCTQMCIRTHTCIHVHIHANTISHVHTCIYMHAQMQTPPEASFYESHMSKLMLVFQALSQVALCNLNIFFSVCSDRVFVLQRELWVLTRLRKNKFCRQRRGLVACSEDMNIISGPLTLQLAIHMKSSHIVY